MGEVVVTPAEAIFSPPEAQTQSSLRVMNCTAVRLALKVKCTDNKQYRLRPVFQFVESQQTVQLQVARLAGPVPSKQDKLLIQYGVAAPEEVNPQTIFRHAGAQFGEVFVPLIPTAQPPDAAPRSLIITAEELNVFETGQL